MKKSKAKETIKLRKQTEELLNKNLSDIKKIQPDEVRNLLEDLQIYQIEIEKYNKQLKKAHEDLRESKEQYLSLVQNSIDGIAIVQGLEIKCGYLFRSQRSVAAAASRPVWMARTISEGPAEASPAAKTPSWFVMYCESISKFPRPSRARPS